MLGSCDRQRWAPAGLCSDDIPPPQAHGRPTQDQARRGVHRSVDGELGRARERRGHEALGVGGGFGTGTGREGTGVGGLERQPGETVIREIWHGSQTGRFLHQVLHLAALHLLLRQPTLRMLPLGIGPHVQESSVIGQQQLNWTPRLSVWQGEENNVQALPIFLLLIKY